MINSKHEIRNSKNGFTLLEVIVATAIFSIAVSSISALFMAAVQTQRNVLAQQDLIGNTRYALEHISRQIRMARRDEDGTCTETARTTFTPSQADKISFIDYRGDCVTYKRTGGQMFIDVNSADQGGGFVNPVPDTDLSDDIALTSDDIRINSLYFEVLGEWAYDVQQPRVIIYVDAEAAGIKPESSPQMFLQTAVSTRNIDTP